MDIDVSFFDDGTIIVVEVHAENTIDDFRDTLDNRIVPYCNERIPNTVDIIYNMRLIQWSFPDFMNYITHTAERRKRGDVPENIRQHFIGTDQWVNNWRSFMAKRFNVETSAFKNVDDALAFVRNLQEIDASDSD